MADTSQTVRYFQYSSKKWVPVKAAIICEKAVTLTVNGDEWVEFMCTPAHLEELALGFLYNEGIISNIEEIADLRVCQTEENIDVWLTNSIEKPNTWKRTSGCTGGFTSIDIAQMSHRPSTISKKVNTSVPAERICSLSASLLNAQPIYSDTGGVHSSAISDGRNILHVAEDIGRHNTLDKLAGYVLLNKFTPHPAIILTTGRLSSEMLQKAVRLDASIVISRTSPSSLSIEYADLLGVTLIGYARRNSFRVYTHHERIQDLKSPE